MGWTRAENCGACYICVIRNVFNEARRVLRSDGTLWIVQGDSYHNGDKGAYLNGRVVNSPLQAHSLANDFVGAANRKPQPGLKPKDLCGQPWRIAFALQADGWWWRDEIIWHKKSCMPSSQRDRCTRSHEVVLMFSRSEKYYYDIDAIKEPVSDSMLAQIAQGYEGEATKDYEAAGAQDPSATKARILHNQTRKARAADGQKCLPTEERNGMRPSKKRGEFGGKTAYFTGREAFRAVRLDRTKRSVWSLAPEPFAEAHFATYPTALIEPMILAGCPHGGTVLDPFGGACTTGLVADRLGRNAILIELNSVYADMGRKRVGSEAPLFTEVS